MCNRPLISVVMSLYRESVEVLERSVQSILQQSFEDFEFIIVVDDPDNREALAYLESIEDKRVKVIVNDSNLGIAKSSNIGIKAAIGVYVARHDADDISLPDRLKTQYSIMNEDHSIDVLGTSLVYIDNRSGKTLFTRKYKTSVGDELKKVCGIAHATVLVKRELYEMYGFYDESGLFSCADEYELWLRWYNKGANFRNIDEVLYCYFQYSSNNKVVNTRKQLKATIRAKLKFRKQLRFSFTDNFYLFMEIVLSKLPGVVIINLFYLFQKLKNRNNRRSK